MSTVGELPGGRDAARFVTANRYAHLDALRAFAVLLVVASHAGLHKIPGDAGVTVFFAISGFIITLLVLREKERTNAFNAGAFYLRRLLKLAPPLLLVVALPSLVYAVMYHLSLPQLASQLFFVFNWVEIAVGENNLAVLPGSSVVWSLSVEEQFYIVFALFWAVAARFRSSDILLVTMALTVIVWSSLSRVVLWIDGASAERIYRGTDVRMDAIAMGVLSAIVYFRSPKGSGRSARGLTRDYVLLSAALVFLMSFGIRPEWFQAVVRPSLHGAVACIVILWGLLDGEETRLRRLVLRAGRARLVTLIGLSSYSIYLVHLSIIRAFERLDLGLYGPVGFVLMVSLSVGLGVIIYTSVEVPVARLKRRFQPLENTASASSESS